MPKIILKINSNTDKIYISEDICCYLLDSSLSPTVFKSCSETDKMVLLYGANAAAQCKSGLADGIIIEPDTKKPLKIQIKKEQELIGNKKAMGIVIPAHRHEAMLVGETEPDFVAFKFKPEEAGAAFDIIHWYNDLFLIQSAIDLTDGLQDIAGIDVDFVIINSHDYKDFGC